MIWRRVYCWLLGHRWRELVVMGWPWQRQCQCCGAIELRTGLVGGWVRVPS